MLVWAFVVWRWEDPFTALYTHVQQQHLEAVYERRAVRIVDARLVAFTLHGSNTPFVVSKS